MAKECVAEMTRNYTASEFIRLLEMFAEIDKRAMGAAKGWTALIKECVERDYGYDVTMTVLREQDPTFRIFTDDVIMAISVLVCKGLAERCGDQK